ncbi:MAG TPA: S8 family serine peptidase, partial [Xanthomonadaceae bacterium]|nr:S8 family serine peptidase [Xanthomonadaceae bacterium]
MRLRSALVVPLLLFAGGAGAQLLPAGPALPQLPGRLVGATLQRTLDDPALRAPLSALRRLRIDTLLHDQRRRVDLDGHGEPVLRGEFLLLGGDAATLAAVQAVGFTATRRDDGEGLGLDLFVLRDTRDRSAIRAMLELQQAAPQAAFAFQHLYLPAGAAGARAAPDEAKAAGDAASPLRIGLIDGGVDARDPAFAGLRLERHGCAGAAAADPHATAVAERLAGHARGVLYAADLWCGDPVGRATLGLVDALAWMARERVPVVNISLVGPDNPVLARAIAALVARGHVVVAAVGNDGPAAPPLYPASYPGVIGVSGVDAKLRALPEAASGAQVDFAASGIDGDGRHALRGTSFAAPVVARLAALRVHAPTPGAGA